MRKYILNIVLGMLFFQSAFAQSERNIKNLTAFSKAYGYIKYFHPSDEANALDWKKFASYGAAEVEKCKDDEQLLQVLNHLFSPIAPSSKFMLKDDVQEYDINSLVPPDSTGYKKIYWQHNGLGYDIADSHEGMYKSVRVNRDNEIEQSADFGNVMTSVEPEKLRGKKIKFEGWAKLAENSEGQGRFWFRVDRKDKRVGFGNNSLDNPVTKDKWEKFSIEGRIDTNAEHVVFGCFLLGKGKLYVDNIKLYYQENDQWFEFPVINSDFESEEISPEIDSELKWMGLGDGYDIQAQNQENYAGKRAVSIEYVGNFITEKGDQLFDCAPQFGEIIQKEIVPGVVCQIPLVLYGNKDETFPSADKPSLNKLTSRIGKVEDEPEDLYSRLGNIIITYNVFQHFYPYFDVVEVDWESEFVKALQRSYSDKDGKEHLKTLEILTATLKDGHIWVNNKYNEYYTPAFLWEWLEDQLVISYVMDSSLAINKGDVVERIEGISPTEYFAEIYKQISAATEGRLIYEALFRSLYGEKGSEIRIQVNSKEYSFPRDHTFWQLRKKNEESLKKYRFFNDSSIVYLNLDLIEMDTIDQLMPVLEESKAIICDLRGYPNANHDFLTHLLKEDDKDSTWMKIPQIIYPDYEKLCGFENHGWLVEAEEPYLGDKQVIFLINARAISYAESYLGFVEGYDLATLIGQPTAGTNGNVNSFSLNGAYKINWTGMKVLKHDGSQHHRIGILPDIRVEKTIKGLKEGRDEYLEKAMEVISKEQNPTP